jgi:hypothetical protein
MGPGQPLEALALLLEGPGQVVTREELQQKLWVGDTFVDFEHGLNKLLRVCEALADEADNPRFVENVAMPPVVESSPHYGRRAQFVWNKRWPTIVFLITVSRCRRS